MFMVLTLEAMVSLLVVARTAGFGCFRFQVGAERGRFKFKEVMTGNDANVQPTTQPFVCIPCLSAGAWVKTGAAGLSS
jgi:hypothetical protein